MTDVAISDPLRAQEIVRRRRDADAVRFGDDEPFVLDPVPRTIRAAEWDALAAGIAQRALALERFVRDVHGPRRCIAEGVLPERVLATARHAEPGPRRPPSDRWIAVAGLDVVRRSGGPFQILEDNVRTPSGLAYALAARHAVSAAVPPDGTRSLAALPAMLEDALRSASPAEQPAIVLVSDGPGSSAWWEHGLLAERLGLPLAGPRDLVRDADGRLHLRTDGRAIDVVYRRTEDDGPDTPAGRVLAGADVAVVNAFGCGIADDKLVHAYVEDLIRFFCGEEPLVRSVPTIPGDDPQVLDRVGELVVKTRDGYGGNGVVIGPHADPATFDRVRAALREHPERYVAQEVVDLCSEPTVTGDRLEPRHVDLRAFALIGAHDQVHVPPGGLTRVALQAGSLVVNSSQGGGAKDTRVAA